MEQQIKQKHPNRVLIYCIIGFVVLTIVMVCFLIFQYTTSSKKQSHVTNQLEATGTNTYLFDDATKAEAMHDYKKAINLYTSYLNANPAQKDNPLLLSLIANAYMDAQDYEGATNWFKILLHNSTTTKYVALQGLAKAYSKKGDVATAINYYQQTLVALESAGLAHSFQYKLDKHSLQKLQSEMTH